METTAFPVPLDLLRFSGTWDGEHGPRLGASLLYEVDVLGRLRALNPLSGEKVDTARQPWRTRRKIEWGRLGGFVRSWIPGLDSLGSTLPQLMKGASRSLSLALRVIKRELNGPWGLVGKDGWSRGVGTFRSCATALTELPGVKVELFGFDGKSTLRGRRDLIVPRGRPPCSRCGARHPAHGSGPLGACPTGLCRRHHRGRPARPGPLDRTAEHAPSITPKGRRYKAVLMFDLQRLADVDL